MKKFSNYQYVEGVPMLERDKQEVGSKFWNKGKWDNFILPFLPEDCSEQILVDMGCNAGIFLEQAEKKGFERVIGIDRDKVAFKRAEEYRERIGGKYELRRQYMERCIDQLPVADYTIHANAHYYFLINTWLEYIEKLRMKTRYIIIVTADKRRRFDHASATIKDIKNYFREWEQVGDVITPSTKGDSYPRKLYGICFKNKLLERVLIDSLTSGNNVQNEFYKELDDGKDYQDTRYYRIIKKYRLKKRWPLARIEKYMREKVVLYEDIKKYGILDPIPVTDYDAPHLDPQVRIMDGNHRYSMWKHLGHKTILVRKI